MRQPCELFVVDRLLPTLRGEIARILHADGMRQADVAEWLGVTQATVSHYIQDRRGERGLLEDLPNLHEFAALLAQEISKGLEGRARAALVCAACGALRSRGEATPDTLRRAIDATAEAWEVSGEWRDVGSEDWSAQPCELVAERFLPLLRERTARVLRESHGMSQSQIARLLQVSQPVVVRYLANRRQDERVFEVFPEIDERAESLANFLAVGMSPSSSVASVCSLCLVTWTKGSGCTCPNVYPSLRPLMALENLEGSAGGQ